MRILLIALSLLVLSCQITSGPFPGANLFVDPAGRYHMFFISPPWEEAPPEIIRTDVPEDPEREDFVILGRGPLGGRLPDAIPVSGVSIFPPRALGGLAAAMQSRREELIAGVRFSEPIDERDFVTDSGLFGREFSFLESGIIFHREFFFAMPDGTTVRIFYASGRDLNLPEIDLMTSTFSAGVPASF